MYMLKQLVIILATELQHAKVLLEAAQKNIIDLREEMWTLRQALAQTQLELANVCSENAELAEKLDVARKDIATLHKEMQRDSSSPVSPGDLTTSSSFETPQK